MSDDDEDDEGADPGGPIRTVSGVITMVFAPVESWSFTSSCMFVPSIPMEEMATTPMTIPMEARIERRRFSRTLLAERLKKMSLMTRSFRLRAR